MTEDEMIGWYHRINGHGFVWTPGVGDGQGGLAYCGSWGHKVSDTTERLNLTELILYCCFSFWLTSLCIIGSSFTQTHVHQVSDAIQPSHHLSSPSPPALNISQHQGLFQ